MRKCTLSIASVRACSIPFSAKIVGSSDNSFDCHQSLELIANDYFGRSIVTQQLLPNHWRAHVLLIIFSAAICVRYHCLIPINRQLGREGCSPPHSGHWQDVVPEEHCASPEERLPVRIAVNTRHPYQSYGLGIPSPLLELRAGMHLSYVMQFAYSCLALFLLCGFCFSALALRRPSTLPPRSKSLVMRNSRLL
jgi:hypothetical protein